MRVVFQSFALSTALAAPAYADGFNQVREKSEFVSLISGKSLTRFGIRLQVSPAGVIEGSAFGTDVTGKWEWQSGLFCRDLAFGKKDLGPNCQMVKQNGNSLRFISDAGEGDSADFRLK
jgi:hypothetical protein